MSESIDFEASQDGADAAGDGALTLRIERLRALRSAFAALAPSALTDDGQTLAQTGRDLTKRLADARRDLGTLDARAIDDLDAALDAFDEAMRNLARSLPVAQMRTTLPGRLARDRRSVLDLLDLLLGGTLDEDGERIGAIDYLVTLLCTQGARRAGVVVHDPVGLTPRLAALSARADELSDIRVDAAETDFYTAANMDREGLREEFQRRTLRQRKVELGPLFFASRILRAVVTYNAALLERVTDEIMDAGDWGQIEDDAAADGVDESRGSSVFASRAMRRLAAATGRRVRGETAPDSPEQRIAAALDLDGLEPSEREALANPSVCTPDDLIGTAILIGLLCRSLAVLSIELQNIGVSPDDVSDVFAIELDGAFQRLIDEKRARDAYKQACALAELRNKFLLEPLAEQLREEHGSSLPFLRPSTPSSVPSLPPTADRVASATANAASAIPTASTAVERPGSPEAPGPISISAAPTPAASRPTVAKSGSPSDGPRRAPNARPTRTPASERRPSARDLVREALEDDRRGRTRAASSHALGSSWSAIRLAQAVLIVVGLAAAGFLYLGRNERDLRALSREQLGIVSPHLAEGRRNGEGHGPGFVGTLDASWDLLALDERHDAAESLVERLREHGLEQVMIYDRNRKLRIQAIGTQPVRSL